MLAEILIICSELLLYLAEEGLSNPSGRLNTHGNKKNSGGNEDHIQIE